MFSVSACDFTRHCLFFVSVVPESGHSSSAMMGKISKLKRSLDFLLEVVPNARVWEVLEELREDLIHNDAYFEDTSNILSSGGDVDSTQIGLSLDGALKHVR